MDETKRCMHCYFYDDFDSQCKAHPPAYAGRIEDGDGEMMTHYSHPIIDLHWAETCGEWRDANPSKTADERIAEILHAAECDRRTREAKDPS